MKPRAFDWSWLDADKRLKPQPPSAAELEAARRAWVRRFAADLSKTLPQRFILTEKA